MSKKNQNRSVSDIFKRISNNLDSLNSIESEKDPKLKREIKEDINELKQFFKGIKKLMLIMFSLFIIAVVLLGYTMYQNEKLRFMNSDLESKKVDSIIKTIMDIKEIKTDSNTIRTTYNYKTRNNNIITYSELVNENDSLKSSVDSISILRSKLKSKISSLEQKLNLAKDNYVITFREFYRVKNKDTINYIQIISRKADSAFMLLNHYRDNLYYDKDEDVWYIRDEK
ncbi:hypothetical protein U1E44_16565 [Arenibacter sp. GZD96]|uniref:hypothetical protein n=1 Tax=Aurantibrevibacter litoralis TaxID=3106030 RepID=UPI002AFF6EB4|nr:hypothetical protein [Arenibacter sp. GZD-96]MEA1787717.1 hypothetical protein [Arenibacter sp. GZD-96]